MRKNYLAGIIALMILILAAVPAMGEISAKNTEANGKITETVWVDDSGNPAAGPEGYARVKYSYKGMKPLSSIMTQKDFHTKSAADITASGPQRTAVETLRKLNSWMRRATGWKTGRGMPWWS